MKKYIKPIAQDLGSILPSAQGNTCIKGSVAKGGGTSCLPGGLASGGICRAGLAVLGCEAGGISDIFKCKTGTGFA